MGLELAKAYVSVEADASRFPSSVDGIKGTVSRSISGLGVAAGTAVGSLAAQVTSEAIRAVSNLISSSIQEAAEGAESSARLATVLRATGYAAKFSAQQLEEYAGALQLSTTFGDEEIKDAMSKLATFKSVSGDMFKRATEAALDMSAVGFGAAEGAAVQLGKALENPIKGVSALARSGVTFTDQEKAKIKALVESNRLLDAQQIVMSAVEGQVRGVAKALGETDGGKLKIIANRFGELKEKIGNELLGAIVELKEELLSLSNIMTDWAVNTIRAITVVAKHREDAFHIASASFEYTINRMQDRIEEMAEIAVPGSSSLSAFARVGETAGRAMVGDASWSDVVKSLTGNVLRKQNEDSGNTKLAEGRMNAIADRLGKAFSDLEQKAIDQLPPPSEINGGSQEDAAQQRAIDGFMSLEEFGRKIQESLLGDDKQQKLIDVTQHGVRIQEQMLQAMTKTTGQGQVAVLG